MANSAEQILGAVRSSVVALADLAETEPSPYVSDAAGFATQAGVCIEKHMQATGQEVPVDPNKPVPPEMPPMLEPEAEPELALPPAGTAPKETSRDRNKAT